MTPDAGQFKTKFEEAQKTNISLSGTAAPAETKPAEEKTEDKTEEKTEEKAAAAPEATETKAEEEKKEDSKEEEGAVASAE
jgi:Ran-binding protein 1